MTSFEDLLKRHPLPPRPGKPVRVGLLGCGYIARDGHFPSIDVLRRAGWQIEVTAVADAREDRLAAATALHPHAATFADADALLDAGLCDAVLVLLWPNLSADLCRRAVDRGLYVFLEKRGTNTAAEMQQLRRDLGGRADRVHVAYNRPMQPLADSWRDRIGARWGETGSSLDIRLWRVQREEPLFYRDVCVHPLSFAISQVGALEVERAQLGPVAPGASMPSWLRAQMRGASGIPVNLEVCPAVGRARESYTYLANGMSCRLDYLAQTGLSDGAALYTWENGRISVDAQFDTSAPIADAALARGFVHQLARFIRLAAGEETTPAWSLDDAAKVLTAWEAVFAAAGVRGGFGLPE